MKKQRGALSAELSLQLAASVVLLIFLVIPLRKAASNYLTALDVKDMVSTITFEANLHYAKQVLNTRCLAQSEIKLSDLGITNDGAVQYGVEYQQTTTPNAAPSGIDITATVKNTKLLGMEAWLSFDEQKGNQFIFHTPLNYELSDFQQIKQGTGCIH
ncbi:transporter [Vibrio harveyi]|uniref:transporter n=1 Tax=Vibrio harveyi TaxID=669 RepID=UPI003CEEFC39